MPNAFKISLLSSIMFAAAAPAVAQSDVEVPRVPLSDVNCDFNDPAARSRPNFCAGTVDGTRTGSATGPVVVSPTNRVSGTYQVDFSGNLQIDGVPVSRVSSQPFTLDASTFYDPDAFRVNIDTTYLGELINAPAPTPFNPAQLPSYFNRYTIQALDVNSIAVNVLEGFAEDSATGQEYRYSLASIDPNNVVANSTALTGVYRSDSESGPIVFGRLSGTARLFAGGSFTQPPYDQTGFYYSPFALNLEVTAEETTRLDENGLVTPTISVSRGINMNGSGITNLAAGVAPGDAVNRAQLDEEAAARTAGDAQLATRINEEAATRAAADTQLGSRIASESGARVEGDRVLAAAVDASNARIATEQTQRIAADNSLASSLASEMSARVAADTQLGAKLDALTTEVDGLSFRIDRLDRKAASGTAVAIAMGGGTFLPGKAVNVTANVSTYDGAHAGAVQVGILVSPNMAVSGSVASGFNRRGKTGARAGVTLGW
jgi:hypothetical protein